MSPQQHFPYKSRHLTLAEPQRGTDLQSLGDPALTLLVLLQQL